MINIIKNIILGKNVSDSDINTFVTNYIFDAKNKNITGHELTAIKILIMHGMFDLNFAIKRYCSIKNYSLIYTIDKHNRIVHVDIE